MKRVIPPPSIPVRSRRNLVAAAFALLCSACHGNDTAAIRGVIDQYAKAVDTADPAAVSQAWSNSPEITFIEPLGTLRGPAQVRDFYTRVIGGTFTNRNLTMKNVSIHAYGDTAWSEFDWDFTANLKSSGAAVENRGSETQIYRREPGGWRILHVHYSAAPAR